MYTLHGHTGPVLTSQFAGVTGNFFASAGTDDVVMVWATNFINTGAGRLSAMGSDVTPPTKPRYEAEHPASRVATVCQCVCRAGRCSLPGSFVALRHACDRRKRRDNRATPRAASPSSLPARPPMPPPALNVGGNGEAGMWNPSEAVRRASRVLVVMGR